MQAGQAPQPPQQQQPNQAPAAAANSHGHNTNAPTTPPPPPAAHEPCVDGSDVREIALLLARFGCNNHTICDEELRPIGVGLYPLGALINHSCRPNCVQTFAGRNIVFRWAWVGVSGCGWEVKKYKVVTHGHAVGAATRLHAWQDVSINQMHARVVVRFTTTLNVTHHVASCCAVLCHAVMCCPGAGLWCPSLQASS